MREPTNPGSPRATTDVLVAGAGPTGLMLAGELALAGVSVTVLDRLPERSERAPGVAINAACAEFLDQRGLLDTIREECFVLPGVHFSLLFLDMSEQRTPHEDAYVVPQHVLTEILEYHASSLGARVCRGHELIGIEAGADKVTAVVCEPAGEYRVDGSYLVGCDGRDSTVRSLLGIGFPGTEAPDCRGLVGEVGVDLASLSMRHFGAYISPGGGIYTAAPSGPDLMRITTIEYGVGAPPRPGPPTEEEFRTSVARVTGAELNCREVRWVTAFTDATRLAEVFAEDRVFLAGDAAHAFFPTNGFGLSMGLGDAVNLGWKLAAAVRGHAPEGLLDSYQQERYPHAERFCTVTRAQGELLHPMAKMEPIREVFRELFNVGGVQRQLIDLVAGLDVRYPLGEDPLLGTRLAPYELLRTDEHAGKSSVAQVLRTGRGVFLRFGQDAPGQARLASWTDRVDVVTVEPVPDIPAVALLLRPDGHIAWSAIATGESGPLHEALSRWFGPER